MSLAGVLQQSLSISFSLPQWFPTLMPTCRKNSTHKFCSGSGTKRGMMVMVCFLVTNPTSLSLFQYPPSSIKCCHKVVSFPHAFTLLAKPLEFTVFFLLYVVLSLKVLFSICFGLIKGR